MKIGINGEIVKDEVRRSSLNRRERVGPSIEPLGSAEIG